MPQDRYVIPAMVDSFLRGYNRGDFRPVFEMPQKGRRNHDFWHASGAFKCHRARVFTRMGLIEAESSGPSMRNFFMGDATEVMVALGIKWACENVDEFKSIKPYLQVSTQVPAWDVKGTADLMLEFPDGTLDVIDIKSCKPGKIDYVKKGESDMGYHGQATTYAEGKRLTGSKIGNVYIVYVDKGNWNTHPDWVHPSEILPQLEADYKKLNDEWARFKRDRTVPAEMPFQKEKDRFKFRRKYTTPGGNGLFPQWLCDKRYCGHIGNCPKVTAWYNEHQPPEEEL